MMKKDKTLRIMAKEEMTPEMYASMVDYFKMIARVHSNNEQVCHALREAAKQYGLTKRLQRDIPALRKILR